MMVRAERPCDRTILTLLQRIVSSKTFARSERLRAFFSYVVTQEREGSGHQLKGYTIGIDVFGRSQAFNADSDPLVRVHAGKLRKLLDEYYADEGSDDDWRIVIPKGTYVPEYRHLKAVPDADAAPFLVSATHKPDIRKAITTQKNPVGKSSWRPAPISSPLALLSVLPLLLLAPLTSPGMTGNSEANAKLAGMLAPSGVSHELPTLTVRSAWPAAGKAAEFADAVRTASKHYSTIAPMHGPISRHTEERRPSPLAFTMEVAQQASPPGLVVILFNDTSGDEVSTDFIDEARVAQAPDILFESVSLVARVLSVRGDIFRFATTQNIQSTLMDCMRLTDTYHKLRTRDAFQDAKTCQERLSPAHRKGLSFVVNASALPGILDR